MNRLVRLCFLIPTLLVAAPVLAGERAQLRPLAKLAAQTAPIRYVTLDRMIHEFASRMHATRTTKLPLFARR